MADSEKSIAPPATYFNAVRVSSSRREVFFDFAQTTGEAPGFATVVARMVTSPGHAKAMLRALGEHIRKYEDRLGTIEDEGGGEHVQ